MQQHQGRLSKMFLPHNAANRIHSRVQGTIVPLICATRFPLLQGSWHGLASLPCNCAHCRNPWTILLPGEIFSAMVRSRLLLSYRLKWSEKHILLSTMVYSKFKILIIFSPSFPSFLYECVLMYQYLYKGIFSFWFLTELIYSFIFWLFLTFLFSNGCLFLLFGLLCSFCIFYCSAISWQDWLSKASKWQVSNGFKLQLRLCYKSWYCGKMRLQLWL